MKLVCALQRKLPARATVTEISVAAALAALAVANILVWQFAPLSTIFMLFCAFPFTLVGLRERLNISLLTVTIAVLLGFLIGGRILAQESFAIGFLGITVGYAEKKHWVWWKSLTAGVGLGMCASAIVVCAFIILADLRTIIFTMIRSIITSLCAGLNQIHAHALAKLVTICAAIISPHWQLATLVWITTFVVCAFYFVRRLYAIPLTAVSQSLYQPHFHIPTTDSAESGNPLPIFLDHVSYSYPDYRNQNSLEVHHELGQNLTLNSAPNTVVDSELLKKPVPPSTNFTPDNVTEVINDTGFIAITGDNGTGKSTLAKILAGLIEPSTGKIIRNGPIGLGKKNGTAIIFQRPESQVLGMRVRDDILFGSNANESEVIEVLTHVGLSHLIDYDTAGLSGGQLQRLAIATALHRHPRLLISDESTSMLDPSAREDIINIFTELSSSTTIVHISHNSAETATAQHVIDLNRPAHHPPNTSPNPLSGNPDSSATISDSAENDQHIRTSPDYPTTTQQLSKLLPTSTDPAVTAGDHTHETHPKTVVGATISLMGIEKTYFPRTPWQEHALGPINLHIGAGQLVALTGSNGAGKSTLARILAGLEQPSAGIALINGSPISHQRRSFFPRRKTGNCLDNVAKRNKTLIAVQHSASQLLATTVAQELQAYTQLDHHQQLAALDMLQLPHSILQDNPQTLSGGQQKRLVLAAIFAAQPELLILDEPLAGCDYQSIAIINKIITQNAHRGMTIIVITHHLAEHGDIFDRQISLADGKIIADSAPMPLPDTLISPAAGNQPLEPSPSPNTWQRCRQRTRFFSRSRTLQRPTLTDLYGKSLPGITPAKRLWVGTKLYVMIAATLALLVRTDWYMATVVVSILCVWSFLAKVPWAALPRIKPGFAVLVFAGELSVIVGTPGPRWNVPIIPSIYSLPISQRGVSYAGLFILLSTVMIYSFLLFSFSTPIADIPPFLQRFIRFPLLHSTCIGLALSLRLLSLNSHEINVMRELANFRWNENSKTSLILRLFTTEFTISLRSCQLVMRRAGEIALTICARGGIDAIGGRDKKPQWQDILIICAVTILLTAAVILRETL